MERHDAEAEKIAVRQLRYETPAPCVLKKWGFLLAESLKTQALQAVLLVAERMSDPNVVNALAEIALQQSPYSVGWTPTNLGAGDVGVAFMYAYLDACFPSQGWDRHTQRYLEVVAAWLQDQYLFHPGMFSGTGGVAQVLTLASKGGRRYQQALESIHAGLSKQVLEREWRRPEANGVASNDFDVISGAAGILAYLVSVPSPSQEVLAAIEYLLAYLTWLGEVVQPLGQERWYIPVTLLQNSEHQVDFPQGNFNCGLSHGIPGPLAALSLTWLEGYRYPGLRETIAYLAEWMIQHHMKRVWGLDWPGSVPFEMATKEQYWQDLPSTHTAWCYGTPGVSRSLWLAGCALEDEHVRQIGREAIESVLRRSRVERGLSSPTICHGVAGLLQICLRFAHECESPLIHEHIPLLVQEILDAFDSAFPLGFRDSVKGIPIDQPGWLMGAPGVAMVLLSAATEVIPTWDRVLVIA